ncbi:mycothiol acetyltransferase [Longispora sp. K20-0274]|uniref:mycothiol acetyltransferase n=1 Tax=Longispora sp. K20-0274 TaxID=3088255 RepID=UPI00399C44F6
MTVVIRTARPDELPALTTFPDVPDRDAATAGYLETLLDRACTRPEWCLVAEDDGRLVGNIVLWSPPNHAVPMDFVLFEPGPAGPALLDAAATLARDLGATRQGHVLDTPAQAPQFQRDPELRETLLTGAGFGLDRDGCRFLWRAGADLPTLDPRLTWRSLADLGEAPFVDFLEGVLTDTKDSIFLAEVAEHGLRGAAERNFQDMLDMDHQPDWYEIGYDADGLPAALSLPARNPGSAVIGLVGVAPTHRGRGFSTDVVIRGLHVLAAAGETEVRGDCDAANVGMFRSFVKAGFANFANRRMFSRSLS